MSIHRFFIFVHFSFYFLFLTYAQHMDLRLMTNDLQL